MADVVQPPVLTRGGQRVLARPILPVHAQRGVFVPQTGGFLSVTLPGEVVRAVVEEVFGTDTATVRLTGAVMAKTGHAFKSNDLVAVRRVDSPLGEKWEPISDREVREQEERERAQRAAHAAAPVAHMEPPVPQADLADTATFPERPGAQPEPKPKRASKKKGAAV